MFDFQKLTVYQKAKAFHLKVSKLIENIPSISRTNKDQLERASFSVALNIAEGSGRFSKADKRNFYIIARSSSLECAAIFDIMCDKGLISAEERNGFFGNVEELSKMLFAMIQNLSKG
jgi:four helix bundle protein